MNKETLLQKVGDLSFCNHLKLLTSEQVAILLNVGIEQVQMYREVGLLKAIKTGKCYCFPQTEIAKFQNDFIGLDCSNRVNAIESLQEVNSRRLQM